MPTTRSVPAASLTEALAYVEKGGRLVIRTALNITIIDRKVVSRSLADTAKAVWHAVETATGNLLAIPPASAFEGGPIRYTWRHAGQWLTVAICEGGLCEWTYRNSATDELWGEDLPADASITGELKVYLTRLAG